MDILDKLIPVYSKIAEQVTNEFPDEVKYRITKIIKEEDNLFSITLELFLPSKINEDNYGICFSFNAQAYSCTDPKIKSKNDELFFISDLSYTDGGIIASTMEGVLKPNNEESANKAASIVIDFTNEQTPGIGALIENLMENR